ncbi:MAG: hypothetical protein GY820_03690 [Gammaproteobacteria bacterium]|nr:hypothetical protein [Gammaproteobacteria bacterium]
MKICKILILIHTITILLACTYTASKASDESPIAQISGGQLSIAFSTDIPKGFSIQSPENRWFYAVDLNEGINHIGDRYPSGKFDIELSSFHATYWDNGKKIEGLVFGQSGKYLLYFADNLETEPENTVHYKKTIFVSAP